MNPFLDNNQIALLRSGADYFPALLSAINNAQHEIYLQTYIFEPDNTGLKIGEALKSAASRDVNVYVVLDGFGSKDIPKTYVNKLQLAGVEVLFYRPKISPWTLKRNRLQRMHRKVSVIDGEIGFVGGINIIDDFNTPHKTSPRLDYAVQLHGPILASMHLSVKLLWRRLYLKKLRSLRNNILNTEQHKPIQTEYNLIHPSASRVSNQNVVGDIRARFLLRDNLWHRRDIEDAYLSAIRAAKTEIVIANAYFLPGLRFRHALRKASERGVRVVLLLQERVEYLLLDFASHALYSAFLKQGIEIFEYHKSFMHSKVAVIDHHWSMVGSSNIDPFSLLMSREANVEIDNAQFSVELRQELQQSMDDGATKVTVDSWLHGHIMKRFFSWIIYGLVRLMIGLAGYSTNR
ncbi:MAG: cardiolipin synthase ClsB [Methylophilaceae bacterium]|nr:cardiolipin synthase ClsB [Methylophilaceae bacterium]